jgi:hypothetical protein
MSNLIELEVQVRKENPKPLFKIVNEETIELTDAEYEESIKNRALMLHQQQNPDLYPKENSSVF